MVDYDYIRLNYAMCIGIHLILLGINFFLNIITISKTRIIAHHLERLEYVTKILSLEMTIFGLKMMVKSGLEKIILKFHVPLQSCCCPVQKKLPRKAELA